LSKNICLFYSFQVFNLKILYLLYPTLHKEKKKSYSCSYHALLSSRHPRSTVIDNAFNFNSIFTGTYGPFHKQPIFIMFLLLDHSTLALIKYLETKIWRALTNLSMSRHMAHPYIITQLHIVCAHLAIQCPHSLGTWNTTYKWYVMQRNEYRQNFIKLHKTEYII